MSGGKPDAAGREARVQQQHAGRCKAWWPEACDTLALHAAAHPCPASHNRGRMHMHSRARPCCSSSVLTHLQHQVVGGFGVWRHACVTHCLQQHHGLMVAAAAAAGENTSQQPGITEAAVPRITLCPSRMRPGPNKVALLQPPGRLYMWTR